jgi:Zn-dependent protease with chaperone function
VHWSKRQRALKTSSIAKITDSQLIIFSMRQRHPDFRELERRNRRQTAALVGVFLMLFCALGLGLDFVIGAVRLRDGHLAGFPLLTVVALVIGSIQSLISYYGGAALVLASAHASELTPDSPRHQMVLDVVQEMALASRMPPPRAYIIDDPAPNAFATGRDPHHSVICVTQGLVDEMDREELQGVLGHEMAHIRDCDIRTMMMIAVLVGGVAMLADFLMRWAFYGGFAPARIPGRCVVGRIHAQPARPAARARTHRTHRIAAGPCVARYCASFHRESAGRRRRRRRRFFR